MRLEVVRIIADWLARSDKGVNAYLPTVPRDAGDPEPDPIADWQDPENTEGKTLAVFDETRHDWASNMLIDVPAAPALLILAQGRISVAGEATPDGQIRRTTAGIEIAIRYISNYSDVARGVRNADYTMRAVLRSLRELSKNDNAESRKRNNILLELFEDPTEIYPIAEVVGNSFVAGALVVHCRCRDYGPAFFGG